MKATHNNNTNMGWLVRAQVHGLPSPYLEKYVRTCFLCPNPMILHIHIVSFCSHLNNPKFRVQTLKVNFTSVCYIHFLLYNSLIKPKDYSFHFKTCFVYPLLSFPLLIFLSHCFPASRVYVSVSYSFYLAMRFCITIVKKEQ